MGRPLILDVEFSLSSGSSFKRSRQVCFRRRHRVIFHKRFVRMLLRDIVAADQKFIVRCRVHPRWLELHHLRLLDSRLGRWLALSLAFRARLGDLLLVWLIGLGAVHVEIFDRLHSS